MCKPQLRGLKQRPVDDGGTQQLPNDGIIPLNLNCLPTECFPIICS